MGSSRTRARTRVPCIGRRILNYCTTREARVNCILISDRLNALENKRTNIHVPKAVFATLPNLLLILPLSNPVAFPPRSKTIVVKLVVPLHTLKFLLLFAYFTIKATSIFPVSKLYISGLIDTTVPLFLFSSMFLRFLHVDPCLWRAHFKRCVLFRSKSRNRINASFSCGWI